MNTLVGFPDDGDEEPDDGDEAVDPLSDPDQMRERKNPFKQSALTPLPAFQCTKVVDGVRCQNWGIVGMLPDNSKCAQHGGRQLSVKEKAAARVDAARLQILQDAGLAVETIEQLMGTGTADNIRLKAATEILDRAGIRGGVEIDLGVNVEINSADEVRKRMAKLVLKAAEDAEDVIEGEVEDDPDEEVRDGTE